MESEITTLTEENKSLSKSINQSKQNITQKEEEKAESNKEVAESNNVENQGNANATADLSKEGILNKLQQMGCTSGNSDSVNSSGSASGLGDNSSGNWNDVTIY